MFNVVSLYKINARDYDQMTNKISVLVFESANTRILHDCISNITNIFTSNIFPKYK